MEIYRHRAIWLLLVLATFSVSRADSPATERHQLVYAPAPADNPLKGLVPYVASDAVDRFPHSMRFHYFSLRELMTGPDQFDWAPVEKILSITQKNGCQLTFRVMLEYPGKSDCLPDFLSRQGVKITAWDTGDTGPGIAHTPDYRDPRLLATLEAFIAALGERYDGDPRIGYITAGLLGLWGEWHTHPRSELFAPKAVQKRILTSYTTAFPTTPILLRYPAGNADPLYAENSNLPFGYHDDSFDWATLETGREDDQWFFMTLLRNAGATDQWKTQPIAGEIRPDLWHTSFTPTPHPKAQGFRDCVQTTHVTWLMDSGLFEKRFALSPARKSAAIAEVQRMGYEFHISEWSETDGQLAITVENRGVAPIYHDWPVELVTGAEGQQEVVANFSLAGLLPGQQRIWRTASPAGSQGFTLRVPNPMPGGKPLRFANREQQADGWLPLQPAQ